jgi:hypothetical protein
VLQAPDHHARRRVAREARDRGLSVRQTEELARANGARPSKARAPKLQSADAIEATRQAEEMLATLLGCEVKVKLGRNGGTAEIRFDDISELSDIARRLSTRRAA